MAHSAQAIKRIRQNETHRLANRSTKSELRTLIKRLQGLTTGEAAKSDESRAAAQALLRTVVSKLDKAARRHVIHANAAARKKSQLTRLVNQPAS